MTDARSKMLKSHRTRKGGFRRVLVRVPVRDVAVIRKAAAILRNPTDEAASLRRHLGFESKHGCVLTALDIFAMPEPLSAEGEALWDEVMAQVERDRRNQVPRPID